MIFFFFKQKTAYEIRPCDWSSDVCSSDLIRAVGVHWVYAPDSDVNNNPGNPIINTRSFGENPQRVAEFVTAFVKGAEDNGALATAKHFPGHGDTAADSHIDLPVIPANRQRLEH